jgi:hypothetical protein
LLTVLESIVTSEPFMIMGREMGRHP